MIWNDLTVNVNHYENDVFTPIKNLKVNFVLFDETNELFYYFEKITDNRGNAFLSNSDDIISQEIEIPVQTQTQRINNANYANESDMDNGLPFCNYTTVLFDSSRANSVSKWFVETTYEGNKLDSNDFFVSDSNIDLTYFENGSGTRSNTTQVKIQVKKNNTYLTGATVVAWLYKSSNYSYVKVSGETAIQGSATIPYFLISNPNFDFDYYIVHAYYNGSSYTAQTHVTVTLNTTTTKTITVTGSSYSFTLGTSYNSYDTLFHYIGYNTPVFPYKMQIANDNGTVYANFSVTSNTSFSQSYTHTCDTRYVRLYISPYNTASEYDETIKRFDIFGYLGGNINGYEIYIPRKKYMFETPLVYDTVKPAAGSVLGYNLPNTNIDISFRGWSPTCTYENHMNSNISAVTIENSTIYNEGVNNDWFYRCLAGINITYASTVKYVLSKNHYDTIGATIQLTLSALTATINGNNGHSVPYTLTSDTIDYLYVCENEPNGGGTNGNYMYLSSNRTEITRLYREPDAVFTRQELQDYVRGFGYTYQGHFYQPSRSGNYDFANYVLPLPQKTPPSKQYFYNDATTNLDGATPASNLTQFKSNFIDILFTDNFITKYTDTTELETHYTNNNNHCYVMEESIIPELSGSQQYFYFYNNCGVPTDSTILSEHSDVDTINTVVGITLHTAGVPNSIAIQYSYNGHPWTDYEIGQEILLLQSHILYFKAKTTNATFSTDSENFYIFDVDNGKINPNPNSCQLSYQDLIDEYCHIGGDRYDTNMITGGVNYNVIVGGKISSLLSPRQGENANLNTYGFYDLFGNCKITSCKRTNNDYLELDLLNVPAHAYEYMFQSTRFLTIGPHIAATSISQYSMNAMFLYSSLTTLVTNKLFFLQPASYCCHEMFKYSNYNKKLEIICSSDGYDGVSFFEEMFYHGYGDSACVNFTNMTIFSTSACQKMFYSSETKLFCDFMTIESIGQNAFYEMYRYSKIGDVNFTVTGSTEFQGCMYMCADLENDCYIDNMHLDANKVATSCYAYMFSNSNRVDGLFVFTVGSISVSGCAYMFYKASSKLGALRCHYLAPMSINNACYSHMFEGAKFKKEHRDSDGIQLCFAPDLPAEELYEECYSYMFYQSNVQMQYSQEIPDINELYVPKAYVLRGTELPKKCYNHMYAESDFLYVSNVITTGLSIARESCCGYMFAATPITTESRTRKIKRDDGQYMIFCRDWDRIGGHSILTRGWDYPYNYNEDTACYVGLTILASGGSYTNPTGNLYLLTGMTAVKNGVTYTFIDSTCEKLKSDITYNHQYQGVSMLETSYTYYTTWFCDTTCYARNSKAYVMTDGYGLDNPSHIGESTSIYINGTTYHGWHWTLISSSTDPKFTSDNRDMKLLGKYAVYNTQEGTNEYSLAATYQVTIPCGGSYNETHTYSYHAASEIVHLDAETLEPYCYEYMFYWCDKLIYGHNFLIERVKNLSKGCFRHMFEYCRGLRTISPDLGDFITYAESSMEYMYANCCYNRKWESRYMWSFAWWDFDTEDLFCGINRIYGPNELRFKYDYNQGRDGHYNCGNSETRDYGGGGEICEFFIDGTPPYWGEFGGLDLKHSSFSDRDSYIFSKTGEGAFKAMFMNCLSLVSCKIKLNATTLYNCCYQYMFKGCGEMVNNVMFSQSITQAKTQCFHAMFEGCYSYSGKVSTNHKLSPTTLATQCYASMFAGCGSMSAAPYLPAQTMVTGCYNNMFNTATKCEYGIEVQVPITANSITGNHTIERTFYFAVSGNNFVSTIFYYFRFWSYSRVRFVDNASTTAETENVNFEVNNVLSKHKKWYSPDTTYFYENFNDAKLSVKNKLQSLCSSHALFYDTNDNRYYNITNYGTITYNNDSDNTFTKVKSGLTRMVCNISKADMQTHNYTWQWVLKIGDDDITKNGSYSGRAYNADHGHSEIPTRWDTHNWTP